MNIRCVEPFEGLGDLRLGIPRQDVRALLNAKFRTFGKGGAPDEADAYDGLGLHLYYDENDELEFIEAFEPCKPEYRGIRLLEGDAEEVLGGLAALGDEPEHDLGSYTFHRIGLSFYVQNEDIESVAIYERSYYDASQ